MSDERRLLVLLKRSDRDAFNRLFEKHARKLYFFTLKSFQNKVDAEEIVQDTFLKIWETRHRIDENLHFDTYLIAIAKHVVYDLLRHKAVERKYCDYIQHAASESYTIEQELAAESFKEYFATNIAQLPAQQKEILLLKSKGYENGEIAEELGLSKRTVETHINRAFKFLRSHLAAHRKVFLVLLFVHFLP